MAKHRSDDFWQARGACRGPEKVAFFPPLSYESRYEREQREAMAKTVCAVCDVRQQCLEYAIAINESQGIWGGLNEKERKAYAAAQRAALRNRSKVKAESGR